MSSNNDPVTPGGDPAGDGPDELDLGLSSAPDGLDEGPEPAASVRGPAPEGELPTRRSRRKPVGFWRRHRALAILASLIGLLALSAAGLAVYLNRQLSGMSRVVSRPDEALRPPAAPMPQTVPAGQSAPIGPPLNILLAGADNGDDGSSISEVLRSGTWRPGQHRSDTIMIMHVPADRRRVYLVSIPRDTFVPIADRGKNKINAAFSFGGPQLMQQTVEQFTGVRMDHLAIIDWNGFRDLSTALGGVTVHVSQTVYDPMSRTEWKAGDITVQGQEALLYVRQRYGLPNGDFDRIQRQQNFLREMLRKLVSRGTLTNPVTLVQCLQAITANVAVDQDFSDAAIRELALQMKDVRTEDVSFLTIPIRGSGSEAGASVLYHDVEGTAALFDAMRRDDLAAYLQAHPGAGTLRAPEDMR